MTCGEDQYMKVTDINTGTQVYTKDTGHNLRYDLIYSMIHILSFFA